MKKYNNKHTKYILTNTESILLVLFLSMIIYFEGFYLGIIFLVLGNIFIKFEKNLFLLLAIFYMGMSIPLSIIQWLSNNNIITGVEGLLALLETLLIFVFHYIGLFLISLLIGILKINRYDFTLNTNSMIKLVKTINWGYVYYIFLALIILYPILGRGYILALDMIYGPKINVVDGIFHASGLNIFIYIQKFLNYFLATDIIQKIILVLIVFLAGLGIHRAIPIKDNWIKYFAGTFYVFNPFFYERLWAGQIGVCLAYAMMPFGLGLWLRFLDTPDWKTALKLSLVTTLMIIFALHWIFIFGLLAVVIAGFYIWSKKGEIRWKNIWKPIVVFVSALFILNSYWIIPNLLNKGSGAVQSFSREDLEVFTPTRDEQYGLFFNLASMYGFWNGDMIDLPKDNMIFWPALTIIFIGLALLGWLKLRDEPKTRWVGNALVLVWIVSIILASGVASHYTRWFNQLLFDHIPFYMGLRDSQKWTSVTVLAYAYLIPFGLLYLWEELKKIKREKIGQTILIGAIFLPIINAYTLLGGLQGHFYTTDYPNSWYETNEMLNKDKENFRVIFLPWHMYMEFDFTETIIANPAELFFDKPIIQGDNMERGELYTHSTRTESKIVEEMIINKKDVAKILKEMNVKNILLSHSADWEEYRWLDKQKELSTIKKYENLTIYLNKLY